MPEQTAEARIRDLERRLDLDPGSRLFVSLAEEYRKVGRVKDALSALQKGLLAHPGYVAAQVALGRVYVEANLNTDAIATFTKVLASDPGNLVAAKSLADIYYARGDNLEALKKFKLYRALSGDRKVDDLIAKIEPQVAPKPITPLKKILGAEPAPPPPSFHEAEKTAARRPTASRLPVPSLRALRSVRRHLARLRAGRGLGQGRGDGRTVLGNPDARRVHRTSSAAERAAAGRGRGGDGREPGGSPVPPAVEPVVRAPSRRHLEPVESARAAAAGRGPRGDPVGARSRRVAGPRELFAAEAPPPADLPEPPALFLSAAGLGGGGRGPDRDAGARSAGFARAEGVSARVAERTCACADSSAAGPGRAAPRRPRTRTRNGTTRARPSPALPPGARSPISTMRRATTPRRSRSTTTWSPGTRSTTT